MNISFSMTTRQIRERTKTVTRRLGWWNTKPGDRLQACDKCMGLKKGQKPVVLCEIEIVSSRLEPLRAIHMEGEPGVRLEGFRTVMDFGHDACLDLWPDLLYPSNANATPQQFIEFFCRAHKNQRCSPSTLVQRIEFKYL